MANRLKDALERAKGWKPGPDQTSWDSPGKFVTDVSILVPPRSILVGTECVVRQSTNFGWIVWKDKDGSTHLAKLG